MSKVQRSDPACVRKDCMVSVTCQADQGDGSASVAITTAGTVAGQFNGGIFFF